MTAAPRRHSLETRAKRRQRSVETRLERDVPLLLYAGVERPPSLDEAVAQVNAHDAQAEEGSRRVVDLAAEMERRGVERRELVATMLTPAELAEHDRRRAALPKSGEYTAEFWRSVLAELHAGAEATCRA